MAKKIGISRQTIVALETKKRPMPWSLYLTLVCV
jgi:DNA-binding XRE family transcriptional regulator